MSKEAIAVVAGENVKLKKAARRMARACRRVIQSCLREEEWHDADEEFERIILAGLYKLLADYGRQGNDATGQ